MPRYSHLLLDADGTLFDYDRAEATALTTTFQDLQLDLRASYVETYREINGLIWREFEQGTIAVAEIRSERFRRLFAALSLDADPVAFGQRYLARLGECAQLIEGAEAAVAALYGKVGLVLITNGLQDVQRARLSRSPIARYLDEIVISEEVGSSKPDSGIFDECFRRMGNPPRRDVLIVGDSLTSDMRGGHNYGIDTCSFNPDALPLTLDLQVRYEIRALDELLGIVGI